jgi:oligopeptide/dipeptide ABC transporter ATP-binding protein
VLGLVGESGAGKSMIGRAGAQLLPPGFAVTAGLLRFDGQDLVRMALGRRRSLLGRDIAFIPQEPLTALNPVLTIGAQLNEHLAHIGVNSRAARRARAIAALDAVHLRDPEALLRRYPHQLSGGMCQRVLIAMAFASRPRLVVADEPTTALDVTVQAQILELVKKMQRELGMAVIWVTHDLGVVAGFCKRVLVMYAGRIVESAVTEELYSRPRHPYTRALQKSIPALQPKGAELYTIPGMPPDLTKEIPGCPFVPRCEFAQPVCDRPVELKALSPDHASACVRAQKGELSL